MNSAQDSNVIGDLRIVLVGKTGSGKSSTGNNILGKLAFTEDNSPESVTKESKRQWCHVDDRRVSVIDTPGIFDTSLDKNSLKEEIAKCIKLSVPGPHAFLLVLRVGVRFTKEEKQVFSWIETNFGADAKQHILAVFTHGDELKGSIETYISKSPDLKEVVQNCGSRYVVLDNSNIKDRTQVAELFEKIDQVVQINGGPYSSSIYEEVQKKLKSDEWWNKVGNAVQTIGKEVVRTGLIATAAVSMPGAVVVEEGVAAGSYLLVAGGGVASAVGNWLKPKPRRDEES